MVVHRSRRRSGELGGATSVLGFLDVNVGVFGIFIVIFAIRILLLQDEAGTESDMLLLVRPGPTAEIGEVTIYTLDEEYAVSGPVFNDMRTEYPLGQNVRATLKQAWQDEGSSLKLEILLPPESFFPFKSIKNALSDEGLMSQEEFFAVYYMLTPVDSLQGGEEYVAQWRGEAAEN